MSFLLVDDRFWTHEKVVAVLMADDRPDRGTVRFISLATWATMGSFCAGQRDDDGRFTLAQASRNLNCDRRRMGMALDLMVEHDMLLAEGEGRYQFRNWAKWRRPKRRDDDKHEPSTHQAQAEQTPSTHQAQAEQTPSTHRARTEHAPSTSQAEAEHEPTVLNDSEQIEPLPSPSPIPFPDPSPSPSPGPLPDAQARGNPPGSDPVQVSSEQPEGVQVAWARSSPLGEYLRAGFLRRFEERHRDRKPKVRPPAEATELTAPLWSQVAKNFDDKADVDTFLDRAFEHAWFAKVGYPPKRLEEFRVEILTSDPRGKAAPQRGQANVAEASTFADLKRNGGANVI